MKFQLIRNSYPEINPRRSTRLYKLSSTLDACEWVDEASKNPIILPRRNCVTDLVIADHHATYRHENRQAAMSQIRSTYNICRLRSEFDRIRKNCQRCQIRQEN